MINFGKERNIIIGIDNCIVIRIKVVNEMLEMMLIWYYLIINGFNLLEWFDVVDWYILLFLVEW